MTVSPPQSPHLLRVGKAIRNPERREYRRWTCALPATLEAVAGPACEVNLLDVSGGGALVMLPESEQRDPTWRSEPLTHTPCILTVRSTEGGSLLARVFGTAYRGAAESHPEATGPVIAIRFHSPLTSAVRKALGCPFRGD